MTERKQYTEEQLEEIADAIWGTGRFRHGTSRYDVPCPVCGSDIRVHVDQDDPATTTEIPAICSVCGIDSSGKATSV